VRNHRLDPRATGFNVSPHGRPEGGGDVEEAQVIRGGELIQFDNRRVDATNEADLQRGLA